ncbi:hypothetical protein CDAR_265121 [Caerostris darwini]|uniref:Uncharacterized protein n=1 Tax=Caerostris darwini TaxID=1538125 RepID=A0AAV4W4Z3_9ARAC|nr:hypothetical protein CDAR_265121 [Caerostris darwini]
MLGNPSTSTISSENLPHTNVDNADDLQHSDITVLGSAETHHQESQDSCLSKLVHLSLDDSPKNSATSVISKKHCESSTLKDSNKMDAVRKKLFEEKKSNENVSSTSKEASALRKAEELRKEKESADVQDLLRMLLVLGDREGIQHVRTTLQTSDIKTTKQKIKRKKKN